MTFSEDRQARGTTSCRAPRMGRTPAAHASEGRSQSWQRRKNSKGSCYPLRKIRNSLQALVSPFHAFSCSSSSLHCTWWERQSRKDWAFLLLCRKYCLLNSVAQLSDEAGRGDDEALPSHAGLAALNAQNARVAHRQTRHINGGRDGFDLRCGRRYDGLAGL